MAPLFQILSQVLLGVSALIGALYSSSHYGVGWQLAAALAAMAAGIRLFTLGTYGIPRRYVVAFCCAIGFVLGGKLWLANSGIASALWPLVPALGILATWPGSASPKKIGMFCLLAGYGSFFMGIVWGQPELSLASGFWAAAAFSIYRRASISLWMATLMVSWGLGPEALSGGLNRSSMADLLQSMELIFWFPLGLGFVAAFQSLGKLTLRYRVIPCVGWIASAFMTKESASTALLSLFFFAAASNLKVEEKNLSKTGKRKWFFPAVLPSARLVVAGGVHAGSFLPGLAGAGLGLWGLFCGLEGRAVLYVDNISEPSSSVLSSAQRLSPSSLRIRLLLAEEALDQNKFTQAEKWLKPLKSLYPRPAELWFLEAALKSRSGNIRESILLAGRGLLEDPGNSKGYTLITSGLEGLDAYAAARFVRRGLMQAPGDTALLKNLASLYEGLGLTAAALDLYSVAAEIKPRDIGALKGACRTSYFLNREELTRRLINRIRRIQPHDPDVHLYLQRLQSL